MIIIIPIRQSWVKKDCFIRLYFNCLTLKKYKIKNVLIADSSDNFLSRKIIAFIASFFGFDYRYFKVKGGVYNPSILKNKAYSYIRKKFKYLLYMDVDVFLNDKTLEYLQNQIANQQQFDWLPVIFLNKNVKARDILHSYNFVKTKNIIQIGYTTGIQFFDVKFFNELGGFDEDFLGYGCEDIDMLHRATGLLNLRSIDLINHDYYLDHRGYNAAILKGFRNTFYRLKENFDINVMPVHLWHKRFNNSNYMLKRKINDEVLIKKMIVFDREFINEKS